MANDRDLDRIEQEIEQVRREASETIAEIENRINPRRLMELGVAAFRDSSTARHMRESVNDGAVPMLLIAAGLGLWAYNMTRHRETGAPIDIAESDEWRSAPTIDELDDDEVLPEDSVPEHHVHVSDSRIGSRPGRAPTPEQLLDIERSHKSASGSASTFRR